MFVQENDKGVIVTGTVKSVDAKGAVVELMEGVEASLKASELSRDRVEDARTHLNEGDQVEARIINVDRKNRAISLSVKAKDMADEKEAMKNLNQAQTQEAAPKTIGDLIKQQLENADK